MNICTQVQEYSTLYELIDVVVCFIPTLYPARHKSFISPLLLTSHIAFGGSILFTGRAWVLVSYSPGSVSLSIISIVVSGDFLTSAQSNNSSIA